MSPSLLATLYDQIPELRPGDDEELWAAGVQEAMRDFRAAVRARYTEGTLARLLASPDAKTRRAAVLALGLVGTMDANPAVAAALHDDDTLVQRFAADAVWELWFRGGSTDDTRRLREAAADGDPRKAKTVYDAIVRHSPGFAEAYNQRAIWFFQRGEFSRAAADCDTVLRLNPYHFGAAAGLGQCCLKLGKPRAAVRAFRAALAINPGLEHLRDTIRSLEEALDRGAE